MRDHPDCGVTVYEPLKPGDYGEDLDDDAKALALARLPPNDRGNAERLRRVHGNDLIFVQGIGWHVWDERRWADENHGGGEDSALMIAHSVVDGIADQAHAAEARASKETDNEARKHSEMRATNLRRWAVNSGNAGRYRAMLDVARPYLRVAADEIDANPTLLTVGNGTVDLTNPAEIQLLKHARQHRITKTADAEYDPHATCPRFLAFIERILPDVDERAFVQRLFGYTLTGLTGEQKMAIFTGKGANGKSTLLEVIASILDGYAATTPIETVLFQGQKRGSDASPDLARLAGVRLLRTAEPEIGARLAESVIKTMTSGEAMVARKLNQDFFEFRPSFKIVLSCNRRPRIRGQDDGIRRRLMIVPFRVQIPEDERDPNMVGKLLIERAGILNWLIEGYQEWRVAGLSPPAAVQVATHDYFDDQDVVGRFMRECIKEVEGDRTGARDLYDAFEIWCRDQAIDPITNTAFGRELAALDYRKSRSNRNWFYPGIQLEGWLIERIDAKAQESMPEQRG